VRAVARTTIEEPLADVPRRLTRLDPAGLDLPAPGDQLVAAARAQGVELTRPVAG